MPLLNDVMFKFIFGYNRNIKFTEYLLECLFDIPTGSLKNKLHVINSFKYDKSHFIDRLFEKDILVLLDDGRKVILEAYTS